MQLPSMGRNRPGIGLTTRLTTAVRLARYAYTEEEYRGKKSAHVLVEEMNEHDLQLVALAGRPSLLVCTKRLSSEDPPYEVWLAFGGTPIRDSEDYYWSRDMDIDLIPYRPDSQAACSGAAAAAGHDVRTWRVHRGFWRLAMDALDANLEDSEGSSLGRNLKELLLEYASMQQQGDVALKVFIVGHSAGGSMAVLTAMHLLVSGIFSDLVCITFGAVTPVNKDAAEGLSRSFEGAPKISSRFVHILSQSDIIPRSLIAPKAMIVSLLVASPDTYWAAVFFQIPFWVVGSDTAWACSGPFQPGEQRILSVLLKPIILLGFMLPGLIRILDCLISAAPCVFPDTVVTSDFAFQQGLMAAAAGPPDESRGAAALWDSLSASMGPYAGPSLCIILILLLRKTGHLSVRCKPCLQSFLACNRPLHSRRLFKVWIEDFVLVQGGCVISTTSVGWTGKSKPVKVTIWKHSKKW